MTARQSSCVCYSCVYQRPKMTSLTLTPALRRVWRSKRVRTCTPLHGVLPCLDDGVGHFLEAPKQVEMGLQRANTV